MRSVLLSALATIVHGGFGSPSCPPNTTLMSSFNYSNSLAGISSPVLLHVCEDITRPDGAIYFMPAYQSLAISPFPLVLSKVTESNQPKNGDDNHYGGVLNYTKQEVLAAGHDNFPALKITSFSFSLPLFSPLSFISLFFVFVFENLYYSIFIRTMR